MNHTDFMKIAAEESERNLATDDGGPFGAVIVKDGAIVGRGHNEVLKKSDPTCHGEMQAIRSACKTLGTHDLSGCILYTSCYPCPMCLSAAIWSNIETVYYGNTAEDAASIGFRDDYIYKFIENGAKDRKILNLIQTGNEFTKKAFHDFQQKTNKKLY